MMHCLLHFTQTSLTPQPHSALRLHLKQGHRTAETSLLPEPVAQLDGDPAGALVHNNVLWFDVAMSRLCFQVEV